MNLIKNRQEELQAKFYEVSEKLYKANAPQDAPDMGAQGAAGAGTQGDANDVEFTDVD